MTRQCVTLCMAIAGGILAGILIISKSAAACERAGATCEATVRVTMTIPYNINNEQHREDNGMCVVNEDGYYSIQPCSGNEDADLADAEMSDEEWYHTVMEPFVAQNGKADVATF